MKEAVVEATEIIIIYIDRKRQKFLKDCHCDIQNHTPMSQDCDKLGHEVDFVIW